MTTEYAEALQFLHDAIKEQEAHRADPTETPEQWEARLERSLATKQLAERLRELQAEGEGVNHAN